MKDINQLQHEVESIQNGPLVAETTMEIIAIFREKHLNYEQAQAILDFVKSVGKVFYQLYS